MCDGGITAIGEQSHSPGAGTPEDELNTLTSFPSITMPPPAAEGPPDGATAGATGSASGESEVEVAVTSSDAVAAVAVAAAAGSPSAAGVDPTGAT
jgi:hypothetical protein